MATFVKCVKNSATADSGTFSVTSVTAGNTLIGVFCDYVGTAASDTLSSSQGGSFTAITSADLNNAGIRLFYLANVASGSHTITYNAGGTATASVVFILEVSGLDTTTPYNGTETNQSAVSSANADTGSVTNNSSANGIFIAGMQDDANQSPLNPTENSTGTVGTWTVPTNGTESDWNTYTIAEVAYQIVTSTASRKHVWASGNVSDTAAAIAFFKDASGAAATSRPLFSPRWRRVTRMRSI